MAWLMPVGAAAMFTLTWCLGPGWSGTARAGETNGALHAEYPVLLAGTFNNLPPARLTSALSVRIPSTNVTF